MSPPVPPDYKDVAHDMLMALNEGKFHGPREIIERAAVYAVRQVQKKDVPCPDDGMWEFAVRDEPPP